MAKIVGATLRGADTTARSPSSDTTASDEVITHGFLNTSLHPFFPPDIRIASKASDLRSEASARFNIGDVTAAALRALCPP